MSFENPSAAPTPEKDRADELLNRWLSVDHREPDEIYSDARKNETQLENLLAERRGQEGADVDRIAEYYEDMSDAQLEDLLERLKERRQKLGDRLGYERE
jgi:hypothetical protein